MSWFFVTDEETADVLVDLAEYFSKRSVFVWPGGLVPYPPALWLMEWTTSYELRKLQVSYARTPTTGVEQDAAMTTHHFLNLTGGIPDASWTTTDYTTVETAFDTYWGVLKAYYHTSYKLAEYMWRADGPAFRPYGSGLSPTLRRVARSVAGTGTPEPLPPQVAITVTETTAAKYTVEDVEGVGAQIRNRWGRFYLPPPGVSSIGQGRLLSGVQTAIADATETFYEACVTAQIIPVMYSPTTGHAWSVLEVHVDDILDVIRSRRYIEPISRAARAITQPT